MINNNSPNNNKQFSITRQSTELLFSSTRSNMFCIFDLISGLLLSVVKLLFLWQSATTTKASIIPDHCCACHTFQDLKGKGMKLTIPKSIIIITISDSLLFASPKVFYVLSTL